MATATLSGVPTIINLAESTANWNGDTFALEPDIKQQGSNSIANAFTGNGVDANKVWVSGTWNFTTAVHLRQWFNIAFISNLSTSNAIQAFISDGSNYRFWTIKQSSTYAGGWSQAVVYTGNTPNRTIGTINLTNITQIGITYNTSSKPRNVPANAWHDAWYYGDGYTVTGGSSVDEIDWSHIAAADRLQAYNITQEFEGAYFLSGDVKVGSGATITYFKDSGQYVIFKDLPVLSTLYKITFQGNGLVATVNGGAYSSSGLQRYAFDCSDSSISLTINGKQFSKSGLHTYTSGNNIQGNTFDNCYQVDTGNCIFKKNNIKNYIGSNGGAVLYPSNDSNLSDCTFENNNQSLKYTSTSDTSSPTLINMIFDDISGKFDLNNTSGSTTTINLSGTSNAKSYTGFIVTFAATNVLEITVVDENTKALLTDARVHVVAGADGTMTVGDVIIDKEITGADGKVVGTISAVDQPYIGLITEAGTPNLYVPKPISGVIPAGTTKITVSLVLDE